MGFANSNKALRIVYRLDNIGNIIRLINVFRNVIGIRQIIAGLKEISAIVEKLC